MPPASSAETTGLEAPVALARPGILQMDDSNGKSDDLQDERTLIERAKRDAEAFAILFEKYHQPIFGYVLRRVAKWSDAQDITSEVFLKAFRSLRRFRWRGISFSSWLYRIATNEVGMYFRRGQRAPISLNELMTETGFEPVDPSELEAEKLEAERKLQQHHEFLAIQAKLATLPRKYQDALTLRFFERKTVKEIAEILGEKEGTVKSLLSRGITRLKERL